MPSFRTIVTSIIVIGIIIAVLSLVQQAQTKKTELNLQSSNNCMKATNDDVSCRSTNPATEPSPSSR